MSDKKKFLDLKPLLRALDLRNKNYYSNLSAEDKKLFSAFMLQRYASSVDGDSFFQEHYLDTINQCSNINFWSLTKHPELQWKLMTMAGATRVQFHPYIHSGGKTKNKESGKRMTRLEQAMPTAKRSDLEVLEAVNSSKDLDKWLNERLGEQ
jgi:hypothetical protein